MENCTNKAMSLKEKEQKKKQHERKTAAAAPRHRLFVKQFKQNNFIVGEDKIVTLKGRKIDGDTKKEREIHMGRRFR